MENRINKPRVFLSHSRKDVEFIKRLAADLQRCHIHPWLDTEEIRDGRPWLKVIFEDGIPTCDMVLVYLTENSLSSKMVEKEIDTALIGHLADSGVSFLPYVSEASLRDKLRGDLRTLQSREWNTRNYDEVLPSVIGEIWQSYMERTVRTATLEEKNRRLELELEMRDLRDRIEGSLFTGSEDKDFQYIHSQLSRKAQMSFRVYERNRPDEKRYVGSGKFAVPILFLLMQSLDRGSNYFASEEALYLVSQAVEAQYLNKQGRTNRRLDRKPQEELFIETELRRFGLTKAVRHDVGFSTVTAPSVRYIDEFTDKMYRFRYWIGYHDHLLGEVELIPQEASIDSPGLDGGAEA